MIKWLPEVEAMIGNSEGEKEDGKKELQSFGCVKSACFVENLECLQAWNLHVI